VTDTGSGREPRFSDDRQWWWTGATWVPASQAPIPPLASQPLGASATTLAPIPDSAPAARTGWRWARWWTVALGLLFCFPIGLVLTWLTSWGRPVKIIVTAGTVLVFGVLIVAAATAPPQPQQQAAVLHSPSPSPSPIPTPTPSPSPPPSPSPVAIATPSPVAKPSPSPVASPSPPEVYYNAVFLDGPDGEMGSGPIYFYLLQFGNEACTNGCPVTDLSTAVTTLYATGFNTTELHKLPAGSYKVCTSPDKTGAIWTNPHIVDGFNRAAAICAALFWLSKN
jgi:hypothetical protein